MFEDEEIDEFEEKKEYVLRILNKKRYLIKRMKEYEDDSGLDIYNKMKNKVKEIRNREDIMIYEGMKCLYILTKELDKILEKYNTEEYETESSDEEDTEYKEKYGKTNMFASLME
jgi:hypothetical protein